MRYLPNPLDSEVNGDPWFLRAYELSDIYWDAANVLLTRYHSTTPPANKISLFPAYYLFGHSLELFLKASVSFSSGNFKFTHEISTLFASFLDAYPTEEKLIPNAPCNFLRHFPTHDPKNENYRYTHTFGLFLDPREAVLSFGMNA